MTGSGWRGRRSLTSDPGCEDSSNAVIAKVKDVKKGVTAAERRVKIETSDNQKMDLLVESRHAKKLDKEKSYKFHLEEPKYMGGGTSRMSGMKMTQRAEGAPTPASDRKFDSRFSS